MVEMSNETSAPRDASAEVPDGALAELLADLEALVTCESPSADLLLGHHDTVWPAGSLATHPFGVDAGVLRGPGCFDMKAGLVIAFHAVAALADVAGVAILVTGDEELGSPSSRALIEAEAAGCAAALVLEASADGGALKTERKGISLYQVTVRGRASHALTAGIGTPTLDGLGAVGGGAHAANEHVLVAELPRRTALLTALITDLLADDQVSERATVGANRS